jgi:intracellular sulfur oxidation DsrE/DsrF family protein
MLLALLPLLATAAPERNKVVFHVNSDSPEQQYAALRNLDNHIAAVGADHLDLKVVLQGGGVTLLLLPEALPRLSGVRRANATPAFRQNIDALRAKGVVFLVSGQYLRQHGIDFRRDLHGVSEADVVDNALSQLSKLQQQGYAYVKP